MAIEFKSHGDVLDFINDTGAMIPSGTPIQMGPIVGVTRRDVPDGERGTVRTAQLAVFEASLDPAGPDNYGFGDAVRYDPATGFATQSTVTGTFSLGFAVGPELGAPTDQGADGRLNSSNGAAAAGDKFVRFVLASP